MRTKILAGLLGALVLCLPFLLSSATVAEGVGTPLLENAGLEAPAGQDFSPLSDSHIYPQCSVGSDDCTQICAELGLSGGFCVNPGVCFCF